jgi:hypothetical protein
MSHQTSFHTTEWKRCNHAAITPVQVGPFQVFLGARPDLKSEVVETMDVICPLNGWLPHMPFGKALNLMSCELPDRGGVPREWPEFIMTIVDMLANNKRVLAYCTGGHGRTGTFGASLIAVLEPDTYDPIEEIRRRHCKEAVESLAQAEGIYALRGEELPIHHLLEFYSPKALDWEKLVEAINNPKPIEKDKK